MLGSKTASKDKNRSCFHIQTETPASGSLVDLADLGTDGESGHPRFFSFEIGSTSGEAHSNGVCPPTEEAVGQPGKYILLMKKRSNSQDACRHNHRHGEIPTHTQDPVGTMFF